jgi:isoquinoline 1-oxidoreductase subunit beta
MSVATRMKRRDFLKTGAAISGGLLLNLYIPDWAPARAAQSTSQPVALNAFVHIGSDDLVTVISNHSEMGQGIYTSLPMLIAEDSRAIRSGGRGV